MAEKQVFPTKGNLIASKRSLAQSLLGYELMDKKRNILIREMLLLSDKAKQLRGRIESTFADAYLALQKANIIMGVHSPLTGQVPIENGVSLGYRSVMGVELPEVYLEYQPAHPTYGVLQSNSQYDLAYVKFNEVKYLSAELAEIENCIYRLATAIKKTQKRANALQNILIPQYRNNVAYISSALEEKEREEFSRQKVIKNNKERAEENTEAVG
jgi:V/A-type H+-transporting ATPase subunit D